MKSNIFQFSQLLGQGLITLLVVTASLAAYDRLVLRPALIIAVPVAWIDVDTLDDLDAAKRKRALQRRAHLDAVRQSARAQVSSLLLAKETA